MAELERIHLEIVRAVDRHGTMTAAAGTLHLTQSALSHSMRKLEDRLGVEIWNRDERRLRLTQAGEHLLAAANRLIPQFVNAEERLARFAEGEGGTLRVGMECHPCYRWLHKISSPYLEAWPLVDLGTVSRIAISKHGINALQRAYSAGH